MKQSRKENIVGHSAVLSANILFALNAPISKNLMDGMIDGYALALWRMGGAAILFWIASFFTKREKIEKKDWLTLIGAAVIGVIMNQGLFIIGLEYTSPIDAVLLKTATPILTLLIAAIYLKNKINFKKGLGVFIGFTGAVFLILSENNFQVTFSGNMLGNLIILLSSLAYATYFTLFINVIKKYAPVTVMKWLFLFSTILCIPFWGNHFLASDFQNFTSETILTLCYVTIMATFIAYLLLPVGQKKLMPTAVSMYIYTQPIIVSIVSLMCGTTKLSLSRISAALLIFAGVYLVTTHPKEKI
ncbi:MAG: DMT family transporter [Bacteroidales bacterium]|nr:DMT family transporter [Bacteroidales bacterium]